MQCRGVPRSDGARAGARNKFCTSKFEPEVVLEQICCVEESTWDIAGTFRRPGHCAPIAPLPRYAFDAMTHC